MIEDENNKDKNGKSVKDYDGEPIISISEHLSPYTMYQAHLITKEQYDKQLADREFEIKPNKG